MSNINHNKIYSFYILYKTTCLVNRKYYLGCHVTNNLNDGYLGSGKIFRRALKKYGAHNFKREILYTFTNQSDMFAKERLVVNESVINDPCSYNLVIGGSGGFKIQDIPAWREKLKIASGTRLNNKPALGLKHTKETKQKISESLKGRPTWNKGLPGTFMGKSHTTITKQKISKSRKGLTAGKNNPMYGKSAVKGRKWYNNGTKTFYLFPDDSTIAELNLSPGRKLAN